MRSAVRRAANAPPRPGGAELRATRGLTTASCRPSADCELDGQRLVDGLFNLVGVSGNLDQRCDSDVRKALPPGLSEARRVLRYLQRDHDHRTLPRAQSPSRRSRVANAIVTDPHGLAQTGRAIGQIGVCCSRRFPDGRRRHWCRGPGPRAPWDVPAAGFARGSGARIGPWTERGSVDSLAPDDHRRCDRLVAQCGQRSRRGSC